MSEEIAMLQHRRSSGSLGSSPPSAPGQKPVTLGITLGDVMGALRWTNPVTFSGKLLQTVTGVEPDSFFLAEQIIQESATEIDLTYGHYNALNRYSQANPSDGRILRNALAQEPSYFIGGLLVGANSDADAITFGNSIFFSAHPDYSTFIHEMVHIDQYDRAGRIGFLTTYYGLTLATVIKRALSSQPLNVMKSNRYETEAYALEERFKAWFAANPNP
jgi:hypothetical protein